MQVSKTTMAKLEGLMLDAVPAQISAGEQFMKKQSQRNKKNSYV